ncbi:transposable element Tcb2 transposase [Trichonephila clavipes]|nr:transposable element Tcb2 transposase [Trichonephila clavipes]
MSALESLHFLTEHRHPTVIEILILLRKLERKGFDIIFSWVPGHVGILGNKQADTTARSMSAHMQRPTLPWPARSPDLSPVEHVWDQLKRQMQSCPSVHDLELAVQDLWAHLPQDNVKCLINSMSDRVAACIAAGESTGKAKWSLSRSRRRHYFRRKLGGNLTATKKALNCSDTRKDVLRLLEALGPMPVYPLGHVSRAGNLLRPGPEGSLNRHCLDSCAKVTRGEPCPGSRELDRRPMDGENMRRALKKESWTEIGVERKERR